MTNLLVSLYLAIVGSLQGFLHEERGDQLTSTIILMLIVIVFGVLLLGGINSFFPTVWSTITTRITTLFNP